jgi:hypothetical protein
LLVCRIPAPPCQQIRLVTVPVADYDKLREKPGYTPQPNGSLKRIIITSRSGNYLTLPEGGILAMKVGISLERIADWSRLPAIPEYDRNPIL